MKYRNRKSKIKGKKKVRVMLCTKKERVAQIIKVIGFITFNTVFAAFAGFLPVLFFILVKGIEIDFERQKYIFLLPSLGYGVVGFITGFINSEAFIPVLYYVCQPLVYLRLFLDECIIKIVNIYNKIFDNIANRRR
jgi:hypothetical protein